MKLQILKAEALDDLKDVKFIENHIHEFSLSDSDWIKKALGYDPFIETRHEMPKLNLKFHPGDQQMTANEAAVNVREVHSKLQFLSDADASQERLWTAICFNDGWQYAQARWNNSLNSAKGIQDHWFFNFGGKRSLIRNALARLWWIGRLTYDPERKMRGEDPYELTDLVCSAQDIIFHVIERNISNNLFVIRPFLEAILESRKEGIVVNTDDIGELAKYLNTLGGTYILDFVGEEWIKMKIKSEIHRRNVKCEKKENREDKPINNCKENENFEIHRPPNSLVGKDSILTIKYVRNGKIVIFPIAKMQKTRPKSLIGFSVGQKFYIGKQEMEIVEIHN